jgi:hypothetical protein
MKPRLHVIDAIRGYCLVNILVNHINAGVLNAVSPSNFGFSDSAELFVLLAGLSTYLAYGHLEARESVARLWVRAAKLYKYNLALIALTLICLYGIARMAGPAVMLDQPLLEVLVTRDAPTVLWHVIGLGQSVGFSMVLRLYIVLMIAAPALLWLASRRWWLPLPPAVVIWALAGHFGLVAHDSLTGTRLTLTILPWTLIFACGIALGAAIRQGVALPRSPWLKAAALTIVLGYFVVLYALPAWPEGQTWATARDEHFWLGSSKTYQSPLRILHVISLAYLFMAYSKAPVLRLVHRVAADNPLVRLGQNSLRVFTFSAVVAVLANEIVNLANLRHGAGSPQAVATEIALVVLGLAGMIAVADLLKPERKRPRTTFPAPITASIEETKDRMAA